MSIIITLILPISTAFKVCFALLKYNIVFYYFMTKDSTILIAFKNGFKYRKVSTQLVRNCKTFYFFTKNLKPFEN